MKIILAVDGSKNSDWAAEILANLPLARVPKISVVHIVDLGALVHPVLAPPLALQYSQAMREETHKSLVAAHRLTQKVAERVRRKWKEVQPVVEKGSVANRIITRARKEKADLIILGSRGLSNIKSFLMGSVSHKVATYAPCSVLVVKSKFPSLKKVLIAVDGSKYSRSAVDFFKSCFRPSGIQARVLNVWDFPLVLPRPKTSDIAQRESKALSHAGFKARPVTVTGHPAAKVIETAKADKSDLVVVGSRGLTGLREFFMGSVSHKIVKYSPSSILIVRSR